MISQPEIYLLEILLQTFRAAEDISPELFYDENKKITRMEIGKIKIEVRCGQTYANRTKL